MNKEWKWEALGLFLDTVIDYRGKTPPKSVTGIPALSAANVKDGKIDLSSITYVSQETYESWTTRGFVKPGDVLITTEAPVGEVASLPDDQIYLITRRIIALRGKLGELDNSFLKYSLLYRGNQERLLFAVRGSTVPRVLKPDILGLEIHIPPYTEQREIANILGSLDDKIEANRRENETLEAMARAIFKSWFVDFDPVHAKVNGEAPYGIDAETASLFPDRFSESRFGLIPSGWQEVIFSSVIEVIGGGTPKTSVAEYWDGDIPWYSIKDVPSSSDVWVLETEKSITQLGVKNSSTRVLDVGTTIVSARGTVGKLALVGTPMGMNQSCYAIRGANGYGSYFTFFLLRSAVEELQQNTHGTVFDTITRNTFDSMSTVAPPLAIVAEFEEIVSSSLKRIKNNLDQNKTLREMRDALLPKLISGELRVGGNE